MKNYDPHVNVWLEVSCFVITVALSVVCAISRVTRKAFVMALWTCSRWHLIVNVIRWASVTVCDRVLANRRVAERR
jgi:hypothetical protein